MPSTLETAIRRTRRRIDDLEGPVRQEMAALYQRTITNIEQELKLVTGLIESQPVPISYRQQRLRRLVSQAEREFQRFADDGMRLLERARYRAVSGGAAEAWELLDAAGIERGFAANINTIAVENALSATYSGPVREILDSYGSDAAKTIEQGLLDGIGRGRSSREIVRDIQRELNSPYTRARLESLVRTEMMRSFRGGLNEQYKPVAHLIRGYRWSAAKSVRTCLACLARDGAIQKEPWDQMHVNCRCISSPVPFGSTFAYPTGEEWFARQSEERQRAMLPSREAYDAYQDGRLSLQDFVGVQRDRTWGSSIHQRSGRQALERAA